MELCVEKNIGALVRSTLILLVLVRWVTVVDASGRLQNQYDLSDSDLQILLHLTKSRNTNRHLQELQDAYTDGICKTLVQPYGYPCEEYTVQTEDGFLLAVQQISHGSGGAPVFLQHGIMAGGETWLFNGPNESYAFILADLGFDVWIGNIRCVDWSHGHVSLQPSDSAYWDWSFDELANYDIPAMLELVQSKNSQKVTYIGHSMGTTMFLAALTDKATQLSATLEGAVLICPIALLDYVGSNLIKIAAHVYLDQVFELFGPARFDTHSDILDKLLDKVCEYPSVNCDSLLSSFSGKACCIDKARIPLYLKYYPQPTSSKALAHYAQIVRRQKFAKYDYGAIKNLVHYQQATPPVYDMSQFPSSVPLLVLSGTQDTLGDTQDVADLTQELSQSVQGSIILPSYSHVDFPLSRTANVDFWVNVTSWIYSL